MEFRITGQVDIAALAASQAQELIASALPAAGPLYCWADLLPAVITIALDRASAQAELGHADRRWLEGAARRAAHDWVPLHELERACQSVVGCLCRTLWSVAEPGQCETLLGLSRWAADKLPEVLGCLRGAYIEEMRRLGARRPDDYVIISSLLEGGDARATAAAAGRTLPEPCAVVVISPAGGADPPGDSCLTAALDGVLEALADVAGVFCAPNWERSVLVSLFGVRPGPVGASVRSVKQAAERMLDACESVNGRAFVAGLALSDTSAGADRAAAEAAAIAGLLARSDPPRRAAFSEEIALDVLVGSHQELRRQLVKRVADVTERPDLWITLREFYRADLDRGRTARRLGIHRSTLDYRLNRVERLTGVSPTSVQGILLFAAADAATRIPAAPEGGTIPSLSDIRHLWQQGAQAPAFSQRTAVSGESLISLGFGRGSLTPTPGHG